MSSLTDMDLFDDINDGGGLEPQQLSDDDLPSDEDDDEDDDDDELDTTDIGHSSIAIKKPLAGMLPNTYEGKTAEELFPAFKPNAILQFNKIFGIGKTNHLPKPWANLRKLSLHENDHHQIREATITECVADNETQFLGRLPPVINEPVSDGQDSLPSDMKIANWRVGPARLWYDQIGLSLDLPTYDYGFKLKPSQTLQTQISKDQLTNDTELIGNASLPVNLTRWEDEIIYDTAVLRDKLDLNTPKIRYCGWVPTTNYRSLASFQKSVFGKNVDYLENGNDDDTKYKSWYSIFPIDNYDLMYGDWEKDIIIDPENMERVREPPELTLDENDDHLIFEIPTDPNDCQTRQQQRNRDPRDKSDANTSISPTKSGKIPHKDTRGRVTRKVLTGSGLLKETEDNDDDANDETDSPKNDFWNLSNDEFYNPRLVDSVGKNLGTLNLQHATPAVELYPQLFPTHLNATKLRHFHRPTIKKVLHGKLKPGEYHPIQSIQKISETRAAEREKERQAYGGGEMFYMRRLQDLSGLDSDIVLAEYCEQYPPLLNQIGMATRIKNYFKKKPGKQDNPPMLDYGEIAYSHTSPFQADMFPGEILQAFENHMFRAPIFRHELLSTDFLILRTKQNYHIRNTKNIFTIGQECPLQEVPGPNSKRANIFARDFLQAYIFRLFWKSRDKPKRIKMEDVRKAFPQNAENSIRKRLKMSSDFKRTGGVHCNWWVLRSDFRLPSQEEIRQLVTPEQCCAYYSMQAAEQRLKDAGYGEKLLFAAVDEEAADENDTSKIEDEVKCAPWHTTKAYLDSLKGKCWLQLRGFADPTGCGQGFSYVRVSNKPNAREAETEAIQTKKMVTGTDADLRRLHLKDAKKILNKFGVSDNCIRNLSRWQIIDIVRTMSTQRARDGEGAAMAKFARGSRYSQMEYQEKYKEDCRKIFEVQNKALGSNHLTSTDNETSGNEDSDVDEMRKNLESMLEPTVSKQSTGTKPNVDTSDTAKKPGSRVLKIVRTYTDDNGRQYQRVEYVRKPMVVEAYSKIRTTKDNDFIRQFFALDEDQRESLRRERRRLQEQLRRVRRQDRLQPRNTPLPPNQTTDHHHSPSSHSTNPSPIRNIHLQLNNSDLSTLKLPIDSDLLIKTDGNVIDENHSNLFMDTSHNITSASQLISTSMENLTSNSQSAFANYFSSTSFGDDGQENHEMISPTVSATNGNDPSTLKRRKKSEKDLKWLKCGACGAQGHMRTNRVCPMYGKTTGGNSQTNINVENEDAQHSFDLQQLDTNSSMNIGDVSVKMVEGGGTKLIFAKSVLEKISQKDPSKKSKKPKGSKSSLNNIESIGGDGDESTTNSQSTPMIPGLNLDRPPTPPPIVHVSKIPFFPPIKSSSSSPPVNLTYTPKSSGTLKTTLSHTGSRRKSSTTPTNAENQFKQSQSYVGTIPSIGFRQQPTSTPLSTGPLGTMFSFPPNTPTTPTPSSAGIDYLDKRARTVQRRRIDPLVSFATLLESILNELRDMPEATLFLQPVNPRSYPAYYEIIKNPIDLQTIRQRVLGHTYETREGFLNDMRQLVENSRQFNGEYDQITRDAQTIFAACFQKFAANEDKLMKLEKAINPLLDDDLLVALSYLFERILSEHLMNVENSWPFHHAVSKVRFKDYYDIVKTPMDLEKIKNNILKHTYRSRAAMLADVNLLYTNSVQYNGELHSITAIASKIVQTCKEQFDEHTEQFDALERNIEQQALAIAKNTEQQANDDDDWQQIITTEPISNFSFNPLVEETDDNPDLKSPTTPGMSLETFIARDLSVMEHHIQSMVTEQNEENDDEQLQTTEKITTEDILGNISESDTSDDENDKKQSPSSSLPTSQIQQDISSEILDVLIIGGGLSGLSAGNYLFDNNIKNFLILESRDRVGGRTCTIDYKQHPVDVGGAYVGPFQNRILRLAREFNIRTYRINNKGKNVLIFSNGQRSVYTGTIPTSIGVFTLLDLNYLLCRTQELCEQICNLTPWSNEDLSSKYDRITLEDWLQTLAETEEAKEIYRAAARTILCVEPNEVSMFAWLSYINNGLGIMRLCEVENGAQERKFYGGSQQISNQLREKLGFNRVLLNYVVKHIEWSSTLDSIKVTCDNNKIFSCRHVIIALAPSLYKTIQFEPELPAKKREATERMYMGSIIKTITVFKRPYWKENGYSGSILNTSRESNPVVFSYDDSSDEHQFYAIMGFIVADSSRKWAKQTRDERRQAVCEQYAQAFQCNDLLTGCSEYIEQNWSAEQFSGGCYTDIMPKEVLSSLREQLWTPCGDNGQLFFAGTELATRFSGYMDGAVQAGERAAFEIITKYLKKNDENLSLKWADEEPVDDREECRSSDTTKLMYGPSKIEMLLPKASTVKSILKITAFGLIGLTAAIIKSRFFD